jgi:hypothetical protein
MTLQDVKVELQNGQNFENERADWLTLNKPSANRRLLCIRGDIKEYKTINSYAKRVYQLINKGY